MSDRIQPAELRTIREYLGLTSEALATILGVRHDTVRRWETGRYPIPIGVREEVEKVEATTAAHVGELVTSLNNMATPSAVVYGSDEELWEARPELRPLTARWWRHTVARAAHEVPGVEIVAPAERVHA